MKKVKLYTGTQHKKTINLWGEEITFDNEGVAEVTEEIANKAAKSIPHDYSLEPTRKKTPAVSSYSYEKSGDGVGKRAASVVEKDHKVKVAKQKKDEKEAEKAAENEREKEAEKKDKKADKKKAVKKSKEPESPSEDNKENSEEKPAGNIWK